MLNFGNKEFRNLQEQVLKNAQDIETLKGREDLQIVIVNELPEVGNPNYIYLVAKDDGEAPDVYDEYIWLEDEERYEKIGGVSIDLTNYVTLDSEQTITGAKTFDTDLTLSGEIYVTSGKSIYISTDKILTFYSSVIYSHRSIEPISDNTKSLGSSSNHWKDLYLSGTAYVSTLENASAISFKINGVERFKLTGADAITGRLYPSASNTFDLGTASLYYRNLYLTGNISDGANTVSVANIASKVTSTFISGSFDSNGESTIDTENAGTPEGLFIFTYGNCQCFLRLTATMVNSADVTPIRIACPMIYNSGTVNGWLNITKSGYILILKITDGTNHVDSGYAWTLTKTNLL